MCLYIMVVVVIVVVVVMVMVVISIYIISDALFPPEMFLKPPPLPIHTLPPC